MFKSRLVSPSVKLGRGCEGGHPHPGNHCPELVSAAFVLR
jgi:hypothetical protein